jgi:hypothetical protein
MNCAPILQSPATNGGQDCLENTKLAKTSSCRQLPLPSQLVVHHLPAGKHQAWLTTTLTSMCSQEPTGQTAEDILWDAVFGIAAAAPA